MSAEVLFAHRDSPLPATTDGQHPARCRGSRAKGSVSAKWSSCELNGISAASSMTFTLGSEPYRDTRTVSANHHREPNFIPRYVRLPDRGTLVNRSPLLQDIDDLAATYDKLQLDDRHWRFFVADHPGHSSKVLSATARGRFQLVATSGGSVLKVSQVQ